MPQSGPSLLLINPWIYDFAAYDFFARPLGLLYLAGMPRARGFRSTSWTAWPPPTPAPGLSAPAATPKNLPAPPALSGIPRRYGRYGISSRLSGSAGPGRPPAAILVTSLMTYWYPGVAAADRLAREHFPGAPVILGGVYATLCPDHAREHSGADRVVTGPGEAAIASSAKITGWPPPWAILPPLDDRLSSPIRPCTSKSIPLLFPSLPPGAAPFIATIAPPVSCRPATSGAIPGPRRPNRCLGRTELGLTDAAFYDDALLLEASHHLLLPGGTGTARRTFPFHTPNALHARFITREVARAAQARQLRHPAPRGGNHRPRHSTPGRQTPGGGTGSRPEPPPGGRIQPRKIGVYLLIGLPGQEDEEVAASIRRVR